MALHDVAGAVAIDDIDRAIEAGLLRWNGCVACALAGGLDPTDAALLSSARASRLSALASRERYRARQHRLQERSVQRDPRRHATPSAIPVSFKLDSTLPTAAAAALARAKAKAATRAKP
ncbi:MAG: hypothetical protein ABIO38_07645 [Luteimonas sp.]